MMSEVHNRNRSAAMPPTVAKTSAAVHAMLQGASGITATLLAGAGGTAFLAEYPDMPVRQAVSCLVQAQTGDLVRVFLHDGILFISDVLRRPNVDGALMLGAPGVDMCIRGNSLTFEAEHGITLRSVRLSIFSQTASWVSQSLHQIANFLHIEAAHCQRHVTQMDILRAKNIVQTAEQSLSLRGRISSIQADALLKIDGSQVHMG